MTELFKHDLILEACGGKTVLHIGASDAPYHVIRAEKNALLHQQLQKVAKKLIGIDIDRKSIEDLKKGFGISDIYYGDVVRNEYSTDLRSYSFDCIVLGDVLEHLDNLGIALRNIKRLMKDNTLLILTVPNAFCLFNVKAILTGKENVHPRHTFWPSYETMRFLLDKNGFSVISFRYCFCGDYGTSTIRRKVFYKVVRILRLDYLYDTLLFDCSRKSGVL